MSLWCHGPMRIIKLFVSTLTRKSLILGIMAVPRTDSLGQIDKSKNKQRKHTLVPTLLQSSLSYTKEVEAGVSSIDSNWLNGCCIFVLYCTRETDECTTPEAKNDRRANSLQVSPVSNVILNDLLELSTPRMSSEAASPSPTYIPIPTLAGRRHSIVFPTDSMKVLVGQGDGGMRLKRKRMLICELVIGERYYGRIMDPI